LAKKRILQKDHRENLTDKGEREEEKKPMKNAITEEHEA